MKNIFKIIIISFLTLGCDKEISLPLDKNESNLVIDGSITDQPGPYLVKISKSMDITSPTVFLGVNNAQVVISNHLGLKDTLKLKSNGIYETSKIKGQSGFTYYLEVLLDSKKYTANSLMPQKVNLDSLSINTFLFNGAINYSIIPNYKDPIEIGNSYRFIQRINDTLDKTYHVFNDNLNNGKINQRPLNGSRDSLVVKLKDLVSVEMQCITSNTFLYFNTLSQQSGAGPGGGTTPTNPPSNMEGGALGIFSAHTIQERKIKIQ